MKIMLIHDERDMLLSSLWKTPLGMSVTVVHATLDRIWSQYLPEKLLPPRWLFLLLSPQPNDSIKHGVIVGRLTQRHLREPRKITLLTKWKELITLSVSSSAKKEPGCLYYQCTLCLSYFPQEIETVISGKTNLKQSSWEWYTPGYPHLPRFPTWPTWQRDNGEWCQQLWRLWLSCSPASSAISLQLSLFYCSTGEEFDGVRLMAQDNKTQSYSVSSLEAVK